MFAASGSRDRRRSLPLLIALLIASLVTTAPGGIVGRADANTAVADTMPTVGAPNPARAVAPQPDSMTADGLPTVQIDGVAWAQAVNGTTVYVGGDFDTARPAGSAPGVNTVARRNLLAYDIRTGQLISSFTPNLNSKVRAVAVSPNGSRLYVGGDFTTADGVIRGRVAAYDTASGVLVDTFDPNVNLTVKAIVATDTTVYLGGAFSTIDGSTRDRLAAVSADDGRLLGWSPGADASVNALVLTPDGGRIVAGGAFTTVAGQAAYGLAAISTADGSAQPWAMTAVIRDAGPNAGITSLSSNGRYIFGSGYKFGIGGNFEGTFAADPNTGALVWLEDCHGDTYSTYATSTTVYTASHAHACNNVGGFPEFTPRVNQRIQAFTVARTGVLTPNYEGNYSTFAGQPAPSPLNWYPELELGTFTGQSQAAWTIVGNGDYLAVGGEFPTVNGVAQQGLTRFAIRSLAPNDIGPQLVGAEMPLSVASVTSGQVRVGFRSNWDRDSTALTYALVRDNDSGHPVATVTADSSFWDRPFLSVVESGLVPGSSHAYKVVVRDSDGNAVTSATVSVVVSGGPPTSGYAAKVLGYGAVSYWRLGDAGGSAAGDRVAGADASVGAGVTLGVPGAIGGDTAALFDGTASALVTSPAVGYGQQQFTVQAWVRTSTDSGGQIVDFGSDAVNPSVFADRSLYVTSDGRVLFLVYDGINRTVGSSTTVNDGRWHQLTATLDGGGMRLYVDGALVASRPDITSAWYQYGRWRIGGDSTAGYPGGLTRAHFAGAIDDVAVFPTALSAAQIADIYAARTN